MKHPYRLRHIVPLHGDLSTGTVMQNFLLRHGPHCRALNIEVLLKRDQILKILLRECNVVQIIPRRTTTVSTSSSRGAPKTVSSGSTAPAAATTTTSSTTATTHSITHVTIARSATASTYIKASGRRHKGWDRSNGCGSEPVGSRDAVGNRAAAADERRRRNRSNEITIRRKQ